MSFTCKIVLSEHAKRDGMHRVYLQAIIDRKRAMVPLAFYILPQDFDHKRNCMKPSHPNASDFDAEFLAAKARANTVASKFRQQGLVMTGADFKKHFFDVHESVDLVKFITRELNLKKPFYSENTYKQHNTVINKLTDFKKKILITEVGDDFIKKFRGYLVGINGNSTVEKLMKILKQYLDEAARKGIMEKRVQIKIKTFKSNRTSLTEEEVAAMDAYYMSDKCPPPHKKLLRYFLFSCFTGLRVSDISRITWNNINGDMLTFLPYKTKKSQSMVSVPLLAEKKYLPEYRDGQPVFDTYTDQVNNRYLKDIAEHLKIKKKITYHTARHTFGTLMAEGGHLAETQRMLGHGDIKTTMGYVHTSTKSLVDAKKARFNK